MKAKTIYMTMGNYMHILKIGKEKAVPVSGLKRMRDHQGQAILEHHNGDETHIKESLETVLKHIKKNVEAKRLFTKLTPK